MKLPAPNLDNRVLEDFYQTSLKLAKYYCPEWADHWPIDDDVYFNSHDAGLVIFKLFSKLTEYLLSQYNQIPERLNYLFYNFMGIDLLPAKASKAPLTFYLTADAQEAFIPAGTKLFSEDDSEIIFETSQSLSVVNTKLISAYSINPWDDRYTNHSQHISGFDKGICVFGNDDDEQTIDHILCLGDDVLWNIHSDTHIAIRFHGQDLTPNYFSQWLDSNQNLINTTTSKTHDSLSIYFNLNHNDQSNIDAVQSYWLQSKPDENTRVNKAVSARLPGIYNVSVNIYAKNLQPEATITNNTIVDPVKGYYPFEENPQTGNSLYILSDEVFSKKGSEIVMDFQTGKTLTDIHVTLNWEYWDGLDWQIFGTTNENGISSKFFTDYTCAFTKSGTVLWICPDIKPTEINSLTGRWIRVRIVQDNYGDAGGYIDTVQLDDLFDSFANKTAIIDHLNTEGITFGIEFQQANLHAPFVHSMRMSYSYDQYPVQRIKSLNGCEYQDHDFNGCIKPYMPTTETEPYLYLGFDENISNQVISLFFPLKEKLFGEEQRAIQNPYIVLKDDQQKSDYSWQYFNGLDWRNFAVENDRNLFKMSDIIQFITPANIVRISKFNQSLYWLRIKPNAEGKIICPVIKGIYPNTIFAENYVTVENEILGSGQGKPDIFFELSKKNILLGQVIEVREPAIPSKNELDLIEQEEGKDALSLVKAESGEIKEIWLRWHQVEHFLNSTSISRHYTLDLKNGIITFGNGIKGMLVPKGTNNVVARKYKYGAGEQGNVRSNSINSLQVNIPGIDKVFNPIPSSGGVNQENQQQAVTRAPHTIKNRGKAVTKEDFEWLAREASLKIVKSKCYLKNEDIITISDPIYVIIVPDDETELPLPDSILISEVRQYLQERTLLTLTDRITVIGPQYQRINNAIVYKPLSLAESAIISENIKDKIRTYFNPLKGGPENQGWEFGQSVYTSELAAVIESIAGVDYVKKISLEKIDANNQIQDFITGIGQMALADNALPYAGEISVNIDIS